MLIILFLRIISSEHDNERQTSNNVLLCNYCRSQVYRYDLPGAAFMLLLISLMKLLTI